VCGGCWAIRGPATLPLPGPVPGTSTCRGETATYPPAGALWVEAILLSPGRAVKEGVWGLGGGSAKEHPISAVGLGNRGRCGWGGAGRLGAPPPTTYGARQTAPVGARRLRVLEQRRAGLRRPGRQASEGTARLNGPPRPLPLLAGGEQLRTGGE